MAEPRWFRHSLRIAVVEYRQTVRALWESKGRFAFLCVGIVLMSLGSLGLSALLVVSSQSIDSIAIHASNRGIFGMFWLFEMYVVAQRVITKQSRIDAEEAILTTVSARSVAGGLIVAESLRVASYIGVPTVIITGAIAYVFHTPLSAVFVPLAVTLYVVSSVIAGYVVGFLGALLLVRSRFIARYKTIIGTVLVTILMGGYFVILSGPVYGLGNYRGLLAWLPISWYIDLAAVGSPIALSWANVAGVLISTIVIFVGGGYAIERLTTALWFDDPINVDGDKETTPSTTAVTGRDALTSALRPLRIPSGFDMPTHRVAQTTLIRTWRNPSKLTFLMMPVFVAGVLFVQFARLGLVFELAPVIVAIAVPWIAGAAFGLNPLGDERRVLPTTLTTSITGKQFVDGIAVPGRLIGFPIIIVSLLVANIVGPYSVLEGTGLLVLGAMLLFMSVQFAPLVGMWFPRYSAITVKESREVVPPSITATAIHALVTLGIGIVAAASLLAPESVRTALQLIVDVTVPVLWVRIGGFGIPLVIASALTVGARRYAANRFETYTVE